MTKPELVPLRQQELQIDTPLAFPVVDANHTLLIGEGQLIHSEQQLEALLEIGIFRPAIWRSSQHRLADNHADEHHPLTTGFTQLQLQPGAPVHLRLAGEANAAFVTVKLIGWVADEDIIVSATPAHAPALSPVPGTQMEAKLLAGKGIGSFQSTVLAVSQSPYPHLHLSYPVSLKFRKLRKNLRVTVTLPTQASSDHDAISHDGSISNLSTCGGMLELPQYFAQMGDELLLMFSLPMTEQEQTLALRAVVRNLHTTTTDVPLMQYGLEFVELDAEERAILEHYIFQAMLEH